jgi:hypothetical protein
VSFQSKLQVHSLCGKFRVFGVSEVLTEVNGRVEIDIAMKKGRGKLYKLVGDVEK